MKKKYFLVAGSLIIAMLLMVFGMPAHEAGTTAIMAGATGAFLDTEKIIRGLKEQRSDKLKEIRALVDTSEKESRDFTDVEQSDYDKLKGESDTLERRYQRLEEDLIARKLEAGEEGKKAEEQVDNKDVEKRAAAFQKFLDNGKAELTSEERALITPTKEYLESRGLNKFSAAAGGVLVPATFATQIVEAMLDMGGIRPIASVMRTATGAELQIPTMNDAGEKGELLGDATDRAATEDTKELFDSVSINSYIYSSRVVKIDNELLADETYNLAGLLPRMLGARIANITNEHYTTGTGVKRPEGVLVGAPKGCDAAAADALTFDDFINLEHEVNSVYRKTAHYMFNDKTLKAIKKFRNADGDPLWVDNAKVGAPNTINGYAYQINDEMPDIAARAKSVTFGDHKAYAIRDVDGAVLVRIADKYAEEFRTGFVLFSRHDGKLKDGGTHPVKYLQHPAV